MASTPEVTDGPTGFINGLTELAAKGLLSVPSQAAKSAIDLTDLHLGSVLPPGWRKKADEMADEIPAPEMSDNARRVLSAIGSTPIGQSAIDLYHAAQKAEPEGMRAATDVANILPGLHMAESIGGGALDAASALRGSARDAAPGGTPSAGAPPGSPPPGSPPPEKPPNMPALTGPVTYSHKGNEYTVSPNADGTSTVQWKLPLGKTDKAAAPGAAATVEGRQTVPTDDAQAMLARHRKEGADIPDPANAQGAQAATPPTFTDAPPEDITPAGAVPAPQDVQAQRASTIRKLGVEDPIRESAISGNPKDAATDYHTAQLDGPAGKVMSDTMNRERTALDGAQDRVVRAAGGTNGLDLTSMYNKGNNILKPLEGLSDHYDDQIKDLYSQADARSEALTAQQNQAALDKARTSGEPVQLPSGGAPMKSLVATMQNDAEFLGTAEGQNMLKGLQSYLRQAKLVDDDGYVSATPKQGEEIKQYISRQYQPSSPQSGRLGKMLKDAVDDDITSHAGTDIYKQARDLRARRDAILDTPKGISQLLDTSGPNGINRKVDIEKVADKVTSLGVEQFRHIWAALKEAETVPKLAAAAKAAQDEIRGHFLQQWQDVSQKFKREFNNRGATQYLNQNNAKLATVMTPAELERIGVVNDASHILAVNTTYPGAAVQAANLARSGSLAQAAVKMGASAAGEALLPSFGIGAVLGHKFGEGIAGKMGDAKATKAVQSRLTSLDKYPEPETPAPAQQPGAAFARKPPLSTKMPGQRGGPKQETMAFRHFSDLDDDKVTLDPNYYGRGTPGAERKRVAAGAPKVISAYGKDSVTEPAVTQGRNEYSIQVPKSSMYDLSQDREGIRQGVMDEDRNEGGSGVYDHSRAEQAIKDRGYQGYYVSDGTPEFRGQGRFFTPQEATRVKPDAPQPPKPRLADVLSKQRGGPKFTPQVPASRPESWDNGDARTVAIHPLTQREIEAYGGDLRPTSSVQVLKNPTPEQLKRWAGRDNNELRFMRDSKGDAYIWDANDAVHRQVMDALGLEQREIEDGFSDNIRNAQGVLDALAKRRLADVLSKQRGGPKFTPPKPPLEGMPTTPVKIEGYGEATPGPSERVRGVIAKYMRSANLEHNPPTDYRKMDPVRGKMIADRFEAMEHNPSDPKVAASYDALAKETMAQWQAIKKSGLKVNFIKPGMADPYAASPRLAIEDIQKNNHMWVYPTESGFGSGAADVSDHPLLADSGEKIDGQPAKLNDIFRVVHDYFGHAAEGNGFRGDGEYNAWRLHSEMYTQRAQGALAAETLGQNAWVNYGPHGARNRNASGADTIYADQKAGIFKVPSDDDVEKQKEADAFAKIAPHLTPDEMPEGSRARTLAKNLVDRFHNSLPGNLTHELAAAALAGVAKKDWYRKSAKAISDVFGADAPRFTALLAALSPQTSVESNFHNALRMWVNWDNAGRPGEGVGKAVSDKDLAKIKKIFGDSVQGDKGEDSVLEAWENNTYRALTHGDPGSLPMLSGPKVNSFAQNLRDNVNAVTLDAWMAHFADIEQSLLGGSSDEGIDHIGQVDGKGPVYKAYAAKVREAAAMLTYLTGEKWTPENVQETVWSWAKTSLEKADSNSAFANSKVGPTEGRTIPDLVKNKGITDERIAETPDFAGLFRRPEHADVIARSKLANAVRDLPREESGYANLAGSRSEASKAAQDSLKPHLDAAAQRLEGVRLRRIEEAAAKAAQEAADEAKAKRKRK